MAWSLNPTLPDCTAAPCDCRFTSHGSDRGIIAVTFRGDGFDLVGKLGDLLNGPLEAEAKKLATKITERKPLFDAEVHLKQARADLAILQERVRDAESRKSDPAPWRQKDAALQIVDLDKQLQVLGEQIGKQQAAVEHAQQHAARARMAFDQAAAALAERLVTEARTRLVARQRELIGELVEAASVVLSDLAATETALVATNDHAGLVQQALRILQGDA